MAEPAIADPLPRTPGASPYLRIPLRTLEQACNDIARLRTQFRLPRQAVVETRRVQ